MNTSIPKNIKRLRQRAGLTQEQMAEKLFVTRQTVSLWENGKTQPDIQTLERIAECFEVELMAVLYGEMPNNSQHDSKPLTLNRWLLLCTAIWGISFFLIKLFFGLNFQASVNDWDRIWFFLFGYIAKGLDYYWLPAMGLLFGGGIGWLSRNKKLKIGWLFKSLVTIACVIGCGFICVRMNNSLFFQQHTWRKHIAVWMVTLLFSVASWSTLQLVERIKNRTK